MFKVHNTMMFAKLSLTLVALACLVNATGQPVCENGRSAYCCTYVIATACEADSATGDLGDYAIIVDIGRIIGGGDCIPFDYDTWCVLLKLAVFYVISLTLSFRGSAVLIRTVSRLCAVIIRVSFSFNRPKDYVLSVLFKFRHTRGHDRMQCSLLELLDHTPAGGSETASSKLLHSG